jgi:hypothetical protein
LSGKRIAERGGALTAQPIAEIVGTVPWGGRAVRPVPVYEGDAFTIGRMDRRWLESKNLHRDHLALGPTTRAIISVRFLTLVGLRDSIEVGCVRSPAHVLVDGAALGFDPIKLCGPLHEIVVDPAGVPQRVIVRVRSRPVGPAPDSVRSGSTVEPLLAIGSQRLLQMAAALAWPLLYDVPLPLQSGWSTAAVRARFRELWGTPPQSPRRLLHDLRAMLVTAVSTDGRPMESIPELQPWPWPAERDEVRYPTDHDFIEAKNYLTAVYLVASGAVGEAVSRALDRQQ